MLRQLDPCLRHSTRPFLQHWSQHVSSMTSLPTTGRPEHNMWIWTHSHDNPKERCLFPTRRFKQVLLSSQVKVGLCIIQLVTFLHFLLKLHLEGVGRLPLLQVRSKNSTFAMEGIVNLTLSPTIYEPTSSSASAAPHCPTSPSAYPTLRPTPTRPGSHPHPPTTPYP